MKLFKCLIALSFLLILSSCGKQDQAESQNQDQSASQIPDDGQEVNPRTAVCDPDPVTYTINENSITVNSIGGNVNLLTVHNAASYAYVAGICLPWVGACAPNTESGYLAADDYLLKVGTASGFCWIPFTIGAATEELAEIESVGGTITVTFLAPTVTRLDIHNLDYSTANPSAICNPWTGGACNLPIEVSGFSTGARLLRIEESGNVTWEEITIE